MKTHYYSDSARDDFAGTNINSQRVGVDFKFINRNFFWRIAAFIVYYIIAVPIVYLICKLYYGLKIVNRREIRKVRKNGCFLYGNHTSVADAFIPSMLSVPKKSYIITGRDAVSIKGIRQLVLMLGAVPLPSDLHAKNIFRDAIYERYDGGSFVAVYPEAHLWPYYTGIRDYSPASFMYPVEKNAPVIAFVTTYRRRKILKFIKRPHITVYVSEPFYPDKNLDAHAAREKLRDEVLAFMKKTAAEAENYEYIHYEKKI